MKKFLDDKKKKRTIKKEHEGKAKKQNVCENIKKNSKNQVKRELKKGPRIIHQKMKLMKTC